MIEKWKLPISHLASIRNLKLIEIITDTIRISQKFWAFETRYTYKQKAQPMGVNCGIKWQGHF
jgi:hypothetical protein